MRTPETVVEEIQIFTMDPCGDYNTLKSIPNLSTFQGLVLLKIGPFDFWFPEAQNILDQSSTLSTTQADSTLDAT
jgi:hypothetical protein